MAEDLTPEVTGGRQLPLSADAGAGLSIVDRRHALLLQGEAAADVRDTLGRAAREGVRLARGAKAGDVFELVPPKELAEGLRNGTLRAAAPGHGDASVLVKNARDGRIAGKSDLRQVKPSVVKVLGPAAWQAMALATQQHYLVEITAKLDDIKAGVDEVLDLMKDNRIGTLRHIAELVHDAQAAARRDGRLSSDRVTELRTAARSSKELWHQIATTARRQLGQYKNGKISAEAVEETFAMLVQATHVLAQCSDAMVAVPYRTAAELEALMAEEQDRLYPALPEFIGLCEELAAASDTWREEHERYQERLPKNRVARRLHLPPIEIRRGRGRFAIERHYEPEQRPLSDARTGELSSIARSTPSESPALVAEVQVDGSVVIGPAADRAG